MTRKPDRREFLSLVTAGAAAGCCGSIVPGERVEGAAPGTVPLAAACQTNHILVHYKEPFDYGVMQGAKITDETFVSKNQDLPTCFFADQTRMRWALHHMSVLQRTQRIARSAEVLGFTYQPLTLDAVTVESAQGEEISVSEWLARTSTDGFIVVYLSDKQRPVVATEQYFNGLAPTTLHHLWSMSKSLSVGLVAMALDQGKLRRTDKIGSILPELAKCGLADATLDDVLNMASGVKNFVGPTWTFDGMVSFAMRGLNVASGFLESNDEDTMRSALGCMGFIATTEKEQGRGHGAGFDYKDIDSRTAIAAAERVLGRPFHELFTDLIWSKIGAEHDAYICCDRYGSALTPLGFSATLRDCARWGLMHLPEAGRPVLPEAFVRELVNPHPAFLSPAARQLDTVPQATLENGGYRDQYWIYPKGPGGGFAAGGWMGQQIHVYPSLNVVIVQLATLWPDNYPQIVPDGPAFVRVAEFVSKAYREQGI
jgi:CubicO group peptidase (beta-lactamase class C family)